MAPIVLAALFAAACDSADTDARYVAAPMSPRALTTLTLTPPGGPARSLGYGAGASVAIAATHLGSADAEGCFAAVEVRAAQADGSCALLLRFGPRPGGPGLALQAATLQVRSVGVATCAPLADLSPTGDVTLALSDAGGAWLPMPPPAPGATAALTLDKLYLWPRGTVQLAGGGAQLTLDLASARFGGDVVSTPAAAGACAPCPTGADCRSPYPAFRLRDFQPESVGFNLRTPMDVFLGVPVVLIVTQGW